MTTIVFDKTGTLTKGEFKVSEVLPVNGSKEELLELAAHVEGYSNHPIANLCISDVQSDTKSQCQRKY